MTTLAYRIQYAAHNRLRFRELSWWRKAWVRFWGWFFDRLWRAWVRPHVMPRRYAKDQYRFLVEMRVPPQSNGFVWEDGGVFLGEVREQDGTWGTCCFQGDTEAEVKEEMLEFVRWCAREAGTVNPRGGWTISWVMRKPEPSDYSVTW